ncbi:Uncharacterised protein r2_g257 [Pycnogonum litorale]
MSNVKTVAFLLSASFIISGIVCLKITEFSIPEKAFAGQDVRLNCIYDLENEKLAALMYSKGPDTFYSYLPNKRRKHRTYNNEKLGTIVDLKNSIGANVLLKNVSSKSTGSYECAVYTASRVFKTVTKHMEVV